MALIESREDLLKQADLILPPFISFKGKKKLFKKHQKKLYLAIQNNTIAQQQVLINFNQEFRRTTGHSLWEREELLLPAIKIEQLKETLLSLQDNEKLHYDVRQNVFRKLKVKKPFSRVSIGEKSTEALTAVLDVLNRGIADGTPDIELYLAFINSSWFKVYARSLIEQASVVSLSASLLIKQIQIIYEAPQKPPEILQKHLENLLTLLSSVYIREIIRSNPQWNIELLALLSSFGQNAPEKTLLKKINENIENIQKSQPLPWLEALTKQYFISGNINIFMEGTEACVLIIGSKGKIAFNFPLGPSVVEGKKSNSALYDISGQRIPRVIDTQYMPMDDISKQYIIAPGTKVLILNAIGNYQLVKAKQSTLPEKNAAFQLIINSFDVPDYSNDKACYEHLEKILCQQAYLLNGQHMLDYLDSLSANLDQIKKSHDRQQFKAAELALENLERFLAAIPFYRMSHQSQVKKSLLDVFDQFEEIYFEFYLAENEIDSQAFIENNIHKLNNKSTFDEQLRLLERWLKLAFKAREYLRENISSGENEKLFFTILEIIERLNLRENIWKILNKRFPKLRPKLQDLARPCESCFREKPKLKTPYNNILAALSTETKFQRFRRRHHKAIGLCVGLPLGLGWVVLLTLSAVVLLNPLIGSILIAATLIINIITYPQVVSALFREGIFTLSDHTIKQKKYKAALIISLASSTIYSFMLGITVAFAFLGLSASTLGIFPALILSVCLGLLMWGGNTFLLADLFRQVCVHFDKWGLKQASNNIKTNLQDFFSFTTCRDWQDTVKKCFRLVLQPLFIALAISISFFASLELMRMLRINFTAFLMMCKQCTKAASKTIVDVLFAIGLLSQLPLAAKKRSTSIVFNKWAKWLSDSLSNCFITIINTIKYAYHRPIAMLENIQTSIAKVINTLELHFQLMFSNPSVYCKSAILLLCQALKKLPPALRETSIDKETNLIRHPKPNNDLKTKSLYQLISGEIKIRRGFIALDPTLLASTHTFFSGEQKLRKKDSGIYGLTSTRPPRSAT